MPAYKNQHYVPQFYFRLYSTGGENIWMYNVGDQRCINVPIKSQCQEDYFYGKNPEIEQHFSVGEGTFNTLLSRIIQDSSLAGLSDEDLRNLRGFVTFQRGRTQAAKMQAEEMSDTFAKQILKFHIAGDPTLPFTEEDLKGFRIVDEGAYLEVLLHHLLSPILIHDLEIALLLNETEYDFVFSDSPVVTYNQWHRQIQTTSGGSGFQSPGLQIFCPISPRHCLLFFDKDKYSLRSKARPFRIFSRHDVRSINDLQHFSSIDNLYAGSEDQIQRSAIQHAQLGLGKGGPQAIVIKEIPHEFDPQRSLMVFGQERIPYDLQLKFLKIQPLVGGLHRQVRLDESIEAFMRMIDPIFEEINKKREELRKQKKKN